MINRTLGKNTMPEAFKTSFNHLIPKTIGYRDGCPPLFDPQTYSPIKTHPKETDFGILCDIYEFSIFVDWLEKINHPQKHHNKLLDVGGNTGLIARLFHATGRAKIVHCLDKCDFSNSLSIDRVKMFLSIIQKIKKENPEVVKLLSFPDSSNPHSSTHKIKKALQNIILKLPHFYSFFRYFSFKEYILNTIEICQELHPAPFPKTMWNIPPSNELHLHKYIQGDYYSLNDKYDCITAFSSFDHFSPSNFFKKAYSLLSNEGTIYMWHINWYWLINPPCVFGDFPFACQRLTRDDLERYFLEAYPQEKDKAMKAYDYFHIGEPGYTLNDYTKIAHNNGFRLKNTCRLMPFDNALPTKMANWTFIGDHSDSTLTDVLKDIHCFKKDVTMTDLKTQSFFLIFRKQ